MRILSIRATMSLMLALSLSLLGCGPSAPPAAPATVADDHSDHAHDHDHAAEHAHPTTIAEGLTELKTLQATIKEGLTSGDIEKAHDPLHSIAHLLEDLEKLSQSLPDAAQKEKAIKAVNSLFEAYTKLDEGHHGGPETKYEDVAAEIETATTALTEVAGG